MSETVNEIPPGWDEGNKFVNDTYTPDELTPEEQAEQESRESRKILLDPLIAQYFSNGGGDPRGRESFMFSVAANKMVPESDFITYITNLKKLTDTVYMDGNYSLSDVSRWSSVCESTEQAETAQLLAEMWNSRFMKNDSGDVMQERMSDFRNLMIGITSCNKRPYTPKSKEIALRIFPSLMNIYDQNYLVSSYREKDEMDNNFLRGSEQVGMKTDDPKQINLLLQIYKRVVDYPDRRIGEIFSDVVTRYAMNHNLSTEDVHGFVDNLLPLMQRGDPRIEILLKKTNSWGMTRGDFGISDYVCRAFTGRVTSNQINELIMVSREIPTTSLSKFEQNRVDALELVSVFGSLRDYIHDERPYVHELLVSMVDYYETGDSSSLESVLTKTGDYFKYNQSSQQLLDIANYEREVKKKDGSGKLVKPIDVLRHLVEGTEPIQILPPKTSDEDLNKRLGVMESEIMSGKGVASQESLVSITDYLNQELIRMISNGVIGIEPNLVEAILWVDKKASEFIKNMNYEDQFSAFNKDWFLSILKFNELIASSEYNERSFEDFSQILKRKDMISFDAYKLICQRIFLNVYGLVDVYKEKKTFGSNDWWSGALWSGNLTHELIGLMDPKAATTGIGIRYKHEDQIRLIFPFYHPGD